MTDRPESVFAAWADKAWPFVFSWEAHIGEIHGGTPRNPDVVRDWLRAKAGWTDEMQINAEVDRIFALDAEITDAEVTDRAATKEASRHVNGFRRDENGLYLECRCLKAGIKEAASIARAADKIPAKFGATGKGVQSFFAEHVMVEGDRMYMDRKEHDDLHTRFVKTRFGSGITVEEVAYDVVLTATVKTDWPLTEEQWAIIWLTGQEQGLGASRSQGFGKYVVTRWEPVTTQMGKKLKKTA